MLELFLECLSGGLSVEILVLGVVGRRALLPDTLHEVDVILENILLVLVALLLTFPLVQLSDVLEVDLLLLLQVLVHIDNVAVDLLG